MSGFGGAYKIDILVAALVFVLPGAYLIKESIGLVEKKIPMAIGFFLLAVGGTFFYFWFSR